MQKFIYIPLLSLIISFSLFAFSSLDAKKEFTDIINSNLEFYNKIGPGMGAKGEMILPFLDEAGRYLNCTVAFRGQYIVINSMDDNQIYVYQNHWVDINIKEGDKCDPDIFQKEKKRFVHTDKRRTAEDVLSFIANSNVTVKNTGEKIFVVKHIVPATEENDEFESVVTYDLKRPLFLNPDSNSFRNQYFEYKSIDLSSISLCPRPGEEGECNESQDLSYLIE